MAIPIPDSLKTIGQYPIEESMQVADLTARDAIPSFKRYEGMITYVLSEEKFYYLKGGITNPDWTEFNFSSAVPETDPFAWRRLGNNDITEGTHFLGTTTTSALEFRVNNVSSGFIKSTLNKTTFGYEAGLNDSGGIVAFGKGAGRSNTTGIVNTAIGVNALLLNTTGQSNVAVGFSALSANTSSNNNTAVGAYTLNNNTGSSNTAIGNTAMGQGSGSGSINTAIGVSALLNNTSGSVNVAIGNNSLVNNTTGVDNVAVGVDSLFSITSGVFNVAVGNGCMSLGNNHTYSTAVGKNALNGYSNSSSLENNSFGALSLSKVRINSNRNNAFGFESLKNLVDNSNFNIGIGNKSGEEFFTNGGINLVDNTNWTSTGWTAGPNNYTWIHTPGNTDVLSNTISLTVDRTYNISFTISNRTAGSINFSIGGINTDIPFNSTINIDKRTIITNTNNLQITPTSDFNGTVSVTITDNHNNNCSDSIFIGYNTRPLNNNETNQIIIGNNSIGRGSNTTTIGNSSTTSSKLFGRLNIGTTPEYADNTAALGGGLVAGDVYRTGDNLKVVH
jgi:hypothetical protein